MHADACFIAVLAGRHRHDGRLSTLVTDIFLVEFLHILRESRVFAEIRAFARD